MLLLESLSAGYGTRRVLQNVTGRIQPGEIVGLLGPNGSGKSTLLKATAGLIPSSGTVQVDGHLLSALTPTRRAALCAYLPQQVHYGQPFTCREVVEMGGYAAARPRAELSAKVAESLSRAGATHLAERRADQLSGGEAQKVRMAQLLTQDAPLLLLDEPGAALDFRAQLELFHLLRWLQKAGKTQLLALHDLNLARQLCSQIWLLEAGALRLAGEPHAVLESPEFSDIFGVELERYQDKHGHTILWPKGFDV